MSFKNYLDIIRKFAARNRINLSDLHSSIAPKSIHLHWWKLNQPLQNIGDMLSPVIFDFVKKQKNLPDTVNKKRTTHIYGIGSIIDGGYQNATIWGSGSLRGDRKIWWSKIRKLDIRCVRGPETRRVLMQNGYECPECYGDPAVLLPLFYKPSSTQPLYDYKVVQHYIYGCDHPNAINPMTNDWRSFVDELVKCKLIISSSLHGIILAEAYGIPAVLLQHTMSMFKYDDYYHSTGRYSYPVAKTVEEALSITPAPLPDLTSLRQQLLDSFPVDLWQ